MKKKILIGVFLLLVLVTSIVFLVGAIESYNYDMDPANGVDIMEGMGAAFILGMGGLVVFYEIELFCTVYYFLTAPKTPMRSVLSVLSNLTLLLVFFVDHIVEFGRRCFPNVFEAPFEEWVIPVGLFFVYILLKTVRLALGAPTPKEETV